MNFTSGNSPYAWRDRGAQGVLQFVEGTTSFIPNLPPQVIVQWPIAEVISLLRRRLGDEVVFRCLDATQTFPSPLAEHTTTDWMKSTNMVGINVRTLGSFFRVVSYALTLPSFHDSIHLLPIWEPGIVGSLYGKVSWKINPEFYSSELQALFPALNTPEKQLKVAVNLLHALGKKVGMDVIPHTDRFSEMVLQYPRFFEWVQQKEGKILRHGQGLDLEVEHAIWSFLQKNGTATGELVPINPDMLFNPNNRLLSDSQRAELLFGYPSDYDGRQHRRIQLMREVIRLGFETLPMTMAPPYRGVHINPDSFVVDEAGHLWYDYEFDKPQGMSRVFGPLTRYKFYPSQANSWDLDFEHPNVPAWQYIADQYVQCQSMFHFDFMRGDMAHVQPRPSGVPAHPDAFYDPLHFIKKTIQRRGFPYFAFYAETFLAPPDQMGYGDEVLHLEAIEAETTLGDLQSTAITSAEFQEKCQAYWQWRQTQSFAPCFTIMTADKDDPRFDHFFQQGRLLRYFLGIFWPGLPSYVSMGYEVRDAHWTRAKNEAYTKLYVFQIEDDLEVDKVTHGPYQWGEDSQFWQGISVLRHQAEMLLPQLIDQPYTWLSSFDQPQWAWSWGEYHFVVGIHQVESTHSAPDFELIWSSLAWDDQYPCWIYKKK